MEKNVGYYKIVGTGGIGMGMLFHSETMDTLGRSESRMVTLSDARDYCKQHIVFYYLAAITKEYSEVYPIGFVGNDANGKNLIAEMRREGMDTRFVGICENEPTMISICLQYPDKEGCNFTARNNAAIHVTPQYIKHCMNEISVNSQTIVAVIPEVSVESRMEMLKIGKDKNAFTVLSIPVAEAEAFEAENAFAYCDLLSLNHEEAQAVLKQNVSGEELVKRLYRYLKNFNQNIQLLVTCGNKGAYSATRKGVEYIPPLPGRAVNTTGAGDAFLGGTLAGLARGLPLQKGISDSCFGESPLQSAVEMGTLCAGMAVESEDSIAFDVTLETIKERIEKNNWEKETWFIN